MRAAALLASLVIPLAGCNFLFPRPVETANPQLEPDAFRTIAIIAGGSRREHVNMAQRVRDRVRRTGLVNVVSVKGLWESEIEAVDALCDPGSTPTLDGFAVVEGNRLALWDCPTKKLAFEADGAFEGVDYMTERLLEYLRPKG